MIELGENPLSRDTWGIDRIKEVYADQYAEGYIFRTNVVKKDVEKCRQKCEDEGLEVFVGERAFISDGTEFPHYSTILVREK